MRTRLVQGIAGTQIPGIVYFTCNRWDCSSRVMRRQAPGGADEGGAVHAGCVRARGVMGTDISGQHATLDFGADLIERAMATPAVRNPTHLLPNLAMQIGRSADPPIEPGTSRVRIASVSRRGKFPLDAFEGKGGLDGLLAG